MPLSVVLAVLLTLLPMAASARVYKWVDENGTTVYSNIPPANGRDAKNVKVVLEDEETLKPTAEQAAQAEVLRTQQQILERLYALERRLDARQYASPPPPPPPEYYAPNYLPSTYYPASFYPPVPYPYVIYRPAFIRPVHRFIAPRPAFVSFHRAGIRRVRP